MYGQTGAGKTYTMLGDYSTDINAVSSIQSRPKTPNRYTNKYEKELHSALERVSSHKNLKQSLQKPVLNSANCNNKSSASFKTLTKKSFIVKHKKTDGEQTYQRKKPASIDITTDDTDEARLRMRLTEQSCLDVGLDKLEVTFKQKNIKSW